MTSSIDLENIDPFNIPKPNYNELVPAISAPVFGTLGVPAGVKETAQRADFRPDAFTIAIEGHGYRLAWTRATLCACTPLNTQTQQSDPLCPLCSGSGYYYFGPTTAQDPALIGQLTDAQQAIIKKQNAMVIRGIMTSQSSEQSPFEKLGGWRSGMANLTVRPDNRLAYYDRLVALDSTLGFSEVVTSSAAPMLPTRYLITGGVNLLASVTQRYLPDAHFQIKAGRIYWIPGQGPPAGTRLTAHYFTYATWLVINYPHTVRGTNIAQKNPVPQTPEGNNYDLAVQAIVRLEWLVHADETP